jgi:hypothetical protein
VHFILPFWITFSLKLKDENSIFFTHASKMSHGLKKCHMMEKVRFFISWGFAWGIHHWPSYLPSIISLFLCPLTSQTLTFRANNIWVHIWMLSPLSFFERSCLLKPWKWSHLGQQHKGSLVQLKKKWVTNWCKRYWEYACNYGVEKIRLKRHMKKHFFPYSLFGNWLNRFQLGTIIQKDDSSKLDETYET